MEAGLFVKFEACTKDVRGFSETGEHTITIPLTLKPPKDDPSLMNLIEELWVKKKLEEDGAGPECELPEITVLRITCRGVR